MTSFVMIEGFQYCELDDKAKRKVQAWIDEFPFDYENEVEDETGEIVVVTEYDYFSDWEEQDQQDHCYMNGYIFDKHGKPIHNLILTEHRLNEAKEN